jgi:hypothetical protein
MQLTRRIEYTSRGVDPAAQSRQRQSIITQAQRHRPPQGCSRMGRRSNVMAHLADTPWYERDDIPAEFRVLAEQERERHRYLSELREVTEEERRPNAAMKHRLAEDRERWLAQSERREPAQCVEARRSERFWRHPTTWGLLTAWAAVSAYGLLQWLGPILGLVPALLGIPAWRQDREWRFVGQVVVVAYALAGPVAIFWAIRGTNNRY